MDVANEEWSGPEEGQRAARPLHGEIRDVDPPERVQLEEALARYGDGLLDHLEDAEHVLKVLVRTDIEPHRRIFRMRRASLRTLAPYDPVFLGIPIAHLARKGARLTLEGGGMIAPRATRRIVYVTDKGAQLFCYGRHLLAPSVLRVLGRPEQGDEVLVCREAEGEDGPRYLGIGIADLALRSVVRGSGRGQEKTSVVSSRLDLGLYLRAQQGIPE